MSTSKNQEATQEGTVLHSLFGRTVVRVDNNLIKSDRLRSHEAQTHRFIAENTTIPVPKVYDICPEDGQVVAIVMNYIPGDHIGAVERGKAIIGRIASIEGDKFDSEQEVNEFILGDIVKAAPDILRHYAKFVFMDNHDIVFTHSDFTPRNILVDGGRVTSIIDWDYASWYPEHWEYIQA
ncbi:hypothetical protein PISL3812_00190 [Talaromyces islandicus]|uniref:Aminoglycoside phosphotransferase domain-containing protein n=1 Tax=Talaromyces islandicus TaxID=28573 RepID=A0A0U1LIK1_TALIS|nr:hypothetical protein PISL3812_00190 [Talaromyces islandicus]